MAQWVTETEGEGVVDSEAVSVLLPQSDAVGLADCDTLPELLPEKVTVPVPQLLPVLLTLWLLLVLALGQPLTVELKHKDEVAHAECEDDRESLCVGD